MALIKCPECGTEISDKANLCIKCGCPMERIKIERNNNIGHLADDEKGDDSSNNDIKQPVFIRTILVIIMSVLFVGIVFLCTRPEENTAVLNDENFLDFFEVHQIDGTTRLSENQPIYSDLYNYETELTIYIKPKYPMTCLDVTLSVDAAVIISPLFSDNYLIKGSSIKEIKLNETGGYAAILKVFVSNSKCENGEIISVHNNTTISNVNGLIFYKK